MPKISEMTPEQVERRRAYYRQYSAGWREANRAAVREYDAAYKRAGRADNTPAAIAARERKRSPAYRATTNAARATDEQREKSRAYAAAYRANPANIAKDRARAAVNYAVASGRNARPSSCEHCGCTPERGRDGRSLIRADHWHGYDPEHHLDVQWICSRCDGALERARAASL